MGIAAASSAPPVVQPLPTKRNDDAQVATTSTLPRQIPDGHTRSLGRSLVPGVIVGLLLGGVTAKGVSPEVAAGVAALGFVSTTATVTAINYTNHNGSFHDGKQWNTPIESMGIGAGIGAATGAVLMGMVGKPQAIIAGAISGAVAGGVNGAIYHFFNRPNH